MSFQGKNFQSRSSDNNNTTAKCKHYSSYQYFTIINGEREINEAIKLISCVGSQDLEALKKRSFKLDNHNQTLLIVGLKSRFKILKTTYNSKY